MADSDLEREVLRRSAAEAELTLRTPLADGQALRVELRGGELIITVESRVVNDPWKRRKQRRKR